MREPYFPVFRIQRYCIHDGPGIRTTLFFQGCPLSCAWCHNPESQGVKSGGPGKGIEPGEIESDFQPSFEPARLVREIEKDLIFFDGSGGGVTFSGGEPLSQPELLMYLLKACKEREIHTCLDTSGFAPFGVLAPAAQLSDLILYDIKIVDAACHQKYAGEPSGLVLENLERLSDTKTDLVLRFPLIPSMTDSEQNIQDIIDFLVKRTRFRKVHILPFHNTGQGKYQRLNMNNRLKKVIPPSADKVHAVRKRFEESGFKTFVGG